MKPAWVVGIAASLLTAAAWAAPPAAAGVQAGQSVGQREAQARPLAERAQALADQVEVEVQRAIQQTVPGMGWLGIRISEVTEQKAQQAHLGEVGGVFVEEVEAGSPAAKAGVAAHDIIVEYNGTKVVGVLQFERLVRETPPGRTVSLVVWRDGQRRTLTAQVGARSSEPWLAAVRPEIERMRRDFLWMSPPTVIVQSRTPLLGVRVQEISGQLAQYFRVPGDRGLLVLEVTSGSPAQQAGLRAGDVIYQVEGATVSRPAELTRQVSEKCAAGAVTLGIVRNGTPTTVRVSVSCGATPAAERTAART